MRVLSAAMLNMTQFGGKNEKEERRMTKKSDELVTSDAISPEVFLEQLS